MSVRKLSPQSTAFVVTFWLPCRGDVKTCTAVVIAEKLKKKSAEELSKVTGGLNLPVDFKLPF